MHVITFEKHERLLLNKKKANRQKITLPSSGRLGIMFEGNVIRSVKPNSIADNAGVKVGWVIRRINKIKQPNNTVDIVNAFKKAKSAGKPMLILFETKFKKADPHRIVLAKSSMSELCSFNDSTFHEVWENVVGKNLSCISLSSIPTLIDQLLVLDQGNRAKKMVDRMDRACFKHEEGKQNPMEQEAKQQSMLNQAKKNFLLQITKKATSTIGTTNKTISTATNLTVTTTTTIATGTTDILVSKDDFLSGWTSMPVYELTHTCHHH